MSFLQLPNTGVEVDMPVVSINMFPETASTRDGGILQDLAVSEQVEDLMTGNDAVLERVQALIRGK